MAGVLGETRTQALQPHIEFYNDSNLLLVGKSLSVVTEVTAFENPLTCDSKNVMTCLLVDDTGTDTGENSY